MLAFTNFIGESGREVDASDSGVLSIIIKKKKIQIGKATKKFVSVMYYRNNVLKQKNMQKYFVIFLHGYPLKLVIIQNIFLKY